MKSFIVLGLGIFGKSLALSLQEMGYEVLGVDGDEKIVQEVSNHIGYTMQADVTSEDFLKSVDIPKFDAAIVAVGSNLPVSIMTTVLLKELGARYILVKASEDLDEKILLKVGADKVVLPEKDMGEKVAQNLVTHHFFDTIELSPKHSIISINPPAPWCGKTIGELSVRTKFGVNIIAVKSNSGTIVIPDAATRIGSDSIITMIGENDDLRRVEGLR